MVILIRSNSIVSDPRVEKYIRYYKENNIKHRIIGWDRLNEQLVFPETDFFKLKSLYNQGGFKAIIHRIKWMKFVYQYLKKNKNLIKNIHACDLDTAFPTVLYKLFRNKNITVIFDVFDWYTANFHNSNKLVLSVFKFMEFLTVKYSDEIIICEPERIEQIPYKLKKTPLVLPNIPFFEKENFLSIEEDYKFQNNKITFSYVGGLGAERFLDELLDVAEKGIINLLIAGYGNAKMENRCLALDKLENIRYYGKVTYTKGLNIMYNSDLIYAMYCKSNPNHIYAAPNKYYEAMMLGKPILSTQGISISIKIIKNEMGYVIDESVLELENLIDKLDWNEMNKKGKNARFLWENQFKTYTFDFLNNTYRKIIID